MLYDCMQVFMEEVRRVQTESIRLDTDTDLEYENKYVIDNYIPKEGMHILIYIDNGFKVEEPLNISIDAKKGEIIGQVDSRYQYIRYLDYNSKLVAMNKPIKNKKIHSNNMYSFFVKQDSVLKGEVTEKIVDEYYDSLAKKEKKYTNRYSKELYRQAEKEIGVINLDNLEKIRNWVKEWVRNPSKLPYELTGKDYLKLFFVYQNEKNTKEIYEKENRRYILPNIYNNNEYNLKVNNEVVGLPNNNRSFNSKKSFLQNKTRKTITPYLVSMNEVIWQNRFFDYLYGRACIGKVNIYFDFDEQKIRAIADKGDDPDHIESGLYLRIRKGKEVEILDSNVVIALNPNLEDTFYYRSILEGKDDNVSQRECNTRSQLAAVIDEVFFGKMLTYNFFTVPEKLSITDSVVKNVLLTYRDRLFEWFYRNPKCDMQQLLEEMSMKLVQNSIQNGFHNRARQQLNLMLSLQDYMKRDTRMEEMMEMVQEQFKKYIDMNQEEWKFENDMEYYYAVGQLVDYFLSLSKAAKKPFSLAGQFIAAKDDAMIKENLLKLIEKYSHAIDRDKDVRAKNIISHVMLYTPQTKVQQQYLMAGLMSNNAFYMKKEN